MTKGALESPTTTLNVGFSILWVDEINARVKMITLIGIKAFIVNSLNF
tara:strand:+ start:9640 stop:9783 length:144 start_codon:yes stop_codon:yes gene_type:complete